MKSKLLLAILGGTPHTTPHHTTLHYTTLGSNSSVNQVHTNNYYKQIEKISGPYHKLIQEVGLEY